MNKTTGYAIADFCDVFAYIMLTQVSVSEVLNWVYLILLIISLGLGIVLKIVSAMKDGKVTREEIEDLQKQLDESLKVIQELKEETKKEDENKEEK